jgi:hypothetical protein
MFLSIALAVLLFCPEIIRNIFRAGHRKRPIFDEPAWKIFPLNRVAGRP